MRTVRESQGESQGEKKSGKVREKSGNFTIMEKSGKSQGILFQKINISLYKKSAMKYELTVMPETRIIFDKILQFCMIVCKIYNVLTNLVM